MQSRFSFCNALQYDAMYRNTRLISKIYDLLHTSMAPPTIKTTNQSSVYIKVICPPEKGSKSSYSSV